MLVPTSHHSQLTLEELEAIMEPPTSSCSMASVIGCMKHIHGFIHTHRIQQENTQQVGMVLTEKPSPLRETSFRLDSLFIHSHRDKFNIGLCFLPATFCSCQYYHIIILFRLCTLSALVALCEHLWYSQFTQQDRRQSTKAY